MTETAKVFVYGTLRRGQRNHAVLRGQRFLGESVTEAADFVLHLAAPEAPGGGLPCVQRRAAACHVAGEVYAVDRAALAALDRLESNGTLYRRERVPVRGFGACWMYLIPPGSRWIRFPRQVPHPRGSVVGL